MEPLKKRVFYVLLLPVFFVLHGYTENARYIQFIDLLPLFFSILAGSCLLFIIFKLLLKESRKAGLMTLFCMSFYLFFGALFDFLKAFSPWQFFYKYSVLLVSFVILAVILFIRLRRMKQDPVKVTFFFNLLFIICILADLFSLTIKTTKSNTPVAGISSTNLSANEKAKPDIFLLLFDEYSSSQSLQQLCNFDNSANDSFLVQQGFHLFPHSRSNYPHTYLSMASCLNMDYIKWAKPDLITKRQHYQDCLELIKNNEVAAFLSAAGYEINNQSIFDLKSHPAPVSQRWFNTSTKLITEETLMGRLCYEFDWLFARYALLRKLLPISSIQEQMQNNDKCIARVLQAAKEHSNTPRFVYGHFLLPHFPYFKDKLGNPLPDSIVDAVQKGKLPQLPYYLDYLQYANTELRRMVTTIRENNPGAVIIFLSDHGYRWRASGVKQPDLFFNQNAVYLPSGNYEKFYDSVTNVNQFRILFNTLFAQQYPLLPDSCIMIKF